MSAVSPETQRGVAVHHAEPPSRLGRLWAARGLLFTLVKRDIKVKYKESFLGFFWSFAKPLFLMLIMVVVFKVMMRFGGLLANSIVPYELHLLCGLIPWIWLANGLNDGMMSIQNNAQLIKKVRVTAEVFPIASVLSNFVHFAISLVVLGAVLAIYGVEIDRPIVLLPIAIGIQMIFMVGLALLLSALNVVFRDTSSILEVIITGWFYITPIFYDYSFLKAMVERNPNLEFIMWIFAANPMVGIIAAYRRSILYCGWIAQDGGLEMLNGELAFHLGVSAVMAVGFLLLGWHVFRRLSPVFADRL